MERIPRCSIDSCLLDVLWTSRLPDFHWRVLSRFLRAEVSKKGNTFKHHIAVFKHSFVSWFLLCIDVMFSRENDVCDVILSLHLLQEFLRPSIRPPPPPTPHPPSALKQCRCYDTRAHSLLNGMSLHVLRLWMDIGENRSKTIEVCAHWYIIMERHFKHVKSHYFWPWF